MMARCCLSHSRWREATLPYDYSLRLFSVGRYRIFRRAFHGSIEPIINLWRGAVRRLVIVVDLRELLPRLLGLTLPVPHTGIESVGSQKPAVGAALGDAALIEHDDFVGTDDGRKPMRDHQRGAAARDAFERFLDLGFGVAVR